MMRRIMAHLYVHLGRFPIEVADLQACGSKHMTTCGPHTWHLMGRDRYSGDGHVRSRWYSHTLILSLHPAYHLGSFPKV